MPAGVLVVAIAVACAGCGSLRQSFSRSGSGAAAAKAQPGSQLPSELQGQAMRFADGYAAAVAEAAEELRRRVPTPEARLDALKWKLSQATAAYINAAEANPVTGILDTVTLATLSRSVIEDQWVGGTFGESARPLLETHRQLESEAWKMAGSVLKPDQAQQLRDLIGDWRHAHPDQVQVYQVRLLDFAYVSAPSSEQAARPNSLLGVLRVDPLAGLEPTTRSIEEARLLAERTAYYLQRMPTLIGWHAELVSYQLAGAPETQQLLADSERLTKAMEVFARTSQQLPQLVNDQREAAIDQVFDRLEGNEKALRASLTQLHESAQAGTELAKSADAAIQSLDRFVARFDRDKSPAAGAAARRPFDILDYATTAKEASAAIEQLNATLSSLDRAMPQIQAAAGALEAAGNRLLLRLLLVLAGLIALLLGGGLAVALTYRRLASSPAHT